MLTLPKDYVVFINMWGRSRGHDEIIYNDTNFRTDIRISKKFFQNKLNVGVAFNDIFGSSRQKWDAQAGDVHFYKWNGNDSRGIYVQAAYTFNAARSKYRGEGAAKEELNRL